MEVLEYGFMQRALLASLMVGLVAPAVGVFLVQRRLSLLGDGLGHVALTGVAVGVLTSTAPVGTALVAAVLADVSATGTTLLVVTHETAPLAGVLTRAVVVDHGRIGYDGPLAGAGAGDGGHHHPGEPAGPPRGGYRIDQLRVTTDAARSHLGGR